MDMDNRVGIDCGNGRWVWQRRAMGENWDNCNRTTIEKEYKAKSTKVQGTWLQSEINQAQALRELSQQTRTDALDSSPQ